jgi:dihydrofolate synthase/folylpolyglutamate synthase
MAPLCNFREFEAFLGRFTNYERLPSFRYDGKTLGLERMESLVAEMGHPEASYPAVHVAGTKGKGSTCLMLEALLAAEGFLVGTYTSPHVERLAERIRLDGAAAAENDIVAEVNAILPLLERRRAEGEASFPTFFELMTALAMAAFRSRRVDWAIFEVGLGGRLDATNILRPRLTAITSIGLEHTQHLGSTLREIAREKAGIIKSGVPLVLGSVAGEAAAEIRRIAAQRGAPVVTPAPETVRSDGARTLRLQDLDEPLPAGRILGPALRADLAIAYTLLRRILAEKGKAPGAARVRQAILGLELPARAEVFASRPPVVLDGAHTAESVIALGATLDEISFPRPRTLIFSLGSDKRVPAILQAARPLAEDIILTRSDSARSLSPGVLREELGEGEVVENPEEAFAEAIRRGRPVVVTGSFYLAGRLRPLVRQLQEQS